MGKLQPLLALGALLLGVTGQACLVDVPAGPTPVGTEGESDDTGDSADSSESGDAGTSSGGTDEGTSGTSGDTMGGTAGTGGGGATDGGSTHDGVVCGDDVICQLPEICCGSISGSACAETCADGELPLTCDGPEDCNGGGCCFGLMAGSLCAASPTECEGAASDVLCKSDGDCADLGGACLPHPLISSLSTCQ